MLYASMLLVVDGLLCLYLCLSVRSRYLIGMTIGLHRSCWFFAHMLP